MNTKTLVPFRRALPTPSCCFCRCPPRSPSTRPGIASGTVDAAVAAANRTALFKVVPTQKDAIETAYRTALAAVVQWRYDGHPATNRDASWSPLIETPAHPEYPCAHCILAAMVGTVLKAEMTPGTVLATASPTAQGATRRWTGADSLMREVADARIFDGVHCRNSTEAGLAMGRRIGEITVARLQTASAN